LIQDSIQISSRFAYLDQQIQQIISSLLEHSTKENATTLGIRDDIITALSNVIRRLDNANVEEHRRTREMIIDPQRSVPGQSPHSMETITAKIELLGVSDDEEASLRRLVDMKIMQSLRYPAMTNRYESIVEAYPETFEWAFGAPTIEQRQWSDLSRWLKAEDGVYWINGKAGSGKSTLMKHIYDDRRTEQYLRMWAKSKTYGVPRLPLCFATFFFWNSGTEEQKSQLGLIRSLL
jgi:ABC-type glutathione transport system ATPase component